MPTSRKIFVFSAVALACHVAALALHSTIASNIIEFVLTVLVATACFGAAGRAAGYARRFARLPLGTVAGFPASRDRSPLGVLLFPVPAPFIAAFERIHRYPLLAREYVARRADRGRVCFAGDADKFPAGEIPLRASGDLSGDFCRLRNCLFVRGDLVARAVRDLVRVAVDDSQDADDLAGSELGCSERTRTCPERKLVRVPAPGTIRAYRVPVAGAGDGHIGDRATVKARRSGSPRVVRMLQYPVAAEPARTE